MIERAEELGATVEWGEGNRAVVINGSEVMSAKKVESDNISNIGKSNQELQITDNKTNDIVRLRTDGQYPKATFTINGKTLKGIIYDGKEYYDAIEMCDTVTIVK